MRTLISLLLVLFCWIQLTSSSPVSLHATSNCCMDFSNHIIPLTRIESFYRTRSSCPKPAIVFKTVTGRLICVDPETHWVPGHTQKLNMRTAPAATTAKTLSATATK